MKSPTRPAPPKKDPLLEAKADAHAEREKAKAEKAALIEELKKSNLDRDHWRIMATTGGVQIRDAEPEEKYWLVFRWGSRGGGMTEIFKDRADAEKKAQKNVAANPSVKYAIFEPVAICALEELSVAD